MRKNLYLGLIACAALTMTGCSNDEISYDSSKQEAQPIQFDTYLGKNVQGRGTETTNASIKIDKFGVTAFYTRQNAWTNPTNAPDFMYNQEVSYSDSKWTYSPVKYWPTKAGDKISFFAYAPYSTGNTNGITLPGKSEASTPTSLTFTVNDVASEMIDFVAAQVIDATQQDDDSGENGDRSAVSFNFKHELSRLAFKVKTSKDLETGSHVVLKSAELISNGYYQKGIYQFANANGNVGNWTMTGSDKMTSDYNLESIIKYAATTEENGTDTKIANKTYTVRVVDITSTTPEELFTTGQYLFLIPPAGSTGLTASTAAVKFTYDIVTQDGELAEGYSCTSAEKTVYLPAGILKQGEAYNVTFTFDVDDIEVSGSVATWTNGTDPSDTKVPFTPDTATAD